MENSSTVNPRDTAPLPLAGVRVLEFCHIVMGPTCGLILADMGADVIKIEPVEGDRTRRQSGFAAGHFYNFNRNKRSLAIDIKSQAGKRAIQRLLSTADVLTENFAPGTLEKLGFGYKAAAAVNPRLIYCSLKGFLSGPYEMRPALDEVVQYMAGLAYMTGPPGRPLRAGASVVDIMGGTFGALAILAALRERETTGRGQLVKSALFESAAFLVAQHMAAEATAGRPIPPMPARRSAWAIYQVFETRDNQQIFVAITSDNIWRRFCEAFGLEPLLSDPTLQTNEQRVEARDRVAPIVAEVIKRHDIATMSRRFTELDVPFAPVARPADLFNDPHLNAGGRMLDTVLKDGTHAKLPGLPIEIGEHVFGLRYQAPAIGEHTRELLAEAGCSAAEIDAMFAAGVVADVAVKK